MTLGNLDSMTPDMFRKYFTLDWICQTFLVREPCSQRTCMKLSLSPHNVGGGILEHGGRSGLIWWTSFYTTGVS